MLAMATALMLIPVAPVSAAGTTGTPQAQSTDFSAAKKKKANNAKATKKPKEEYMRAVPSK